MKIIDSKKFCVKNFSEPFPINQVPLKVATNGKNGLYHEN